MSIEGINNNSVSYTTSNYKDKSLSARGEMQNIDIAVAEEDINLAKHTEGNAKQEKAGQEKKQPTPKQIKSALEQANQHAKLTKTACEFSYHEKTNRISIKVKDSETGEVIREIPSEEMLNMVEKMWELAGLLVDEKR